MSHPSLQIADCRLQIERQRIGLLSFNLQSAICNLQFAVALLALCWLCPAAGATPQPQFRLLEKKVEGPVTASAWILTPASDPRALPLSDVATVKLRVEGPASLKLEKPPAPKPHPPNAPPQWSLKPRRGPVLAAAKEKGLVVWEQDYDLDPGQPGEHAVELPALTYRLGKGAPRTVALGPVKLRFTTTIKKVESGSAREITGIEDVAEVPPGHGWLLWAGVALGVLLVGVTAFVVHRRRSARPLPLPAHEWALRELERLAGRRPQSGQEVEAFHTALSLVLRRYLERRFQIPAERQTTAEFLEAVQRSSELTAEQQSTLRELLTQCDLAKFARVWPSAEECHALVRRSRELIETTAVDPPTAGSQQDAPGRL
jgi:hypothetical protein